MEVILNYMAPPILIKNVNIIPMPGSRILHGYDVIIEGTRIKQVLHSRKQERGKFTGRVINGMGKFLIPGLFDMHVHLESKSFFPLFLMNGITTIREVGSTRKGIFQLRDKVNSGKIIGPRMFIAGPILEGDPPFWQGFKNLRTTAEAEEAVKELKKKGADFIKVYETLAPRVYKTILKTAHKLGLNVTGHIPSSMDMFTALRAGQDCFEHIDTLGNSIFKITWKKKKDQWVIGKVKLNHQKLMMLLGQLSIKKSAVCPTLVFFEKYTKLATYKKFLGSQEMKYMPKHYGSVIWNPSHPKSSINIRGKTPQWFRNAGSIAKPMLKIIPLLQKRDIVLLAGSDTPNPFVVPGFSLIEELRLLVLAGLKPFQALEAATYNAAKFLDVLSDLGTVEEGKIANLVLLHKNPLQKISHIQSIEGVILNSTYFSSKDLRKKAKRDS
jgi:imidazolonepropionase-like amidohydrolase